MATDLNMVALVGRLTRDPDMKYSNAGGAILRFSVAVNRSRRNQDGSWGEEANFFDCVYFGKSAEAVSQWLSKGRQVAVQGELRQDSWKTQDGQTRSRVEIWVNNLNLLGGGQRDGQSGGYGQSRSNGGYNQAPQGGYGQPSQGAMQYQGGSQNAYQQNNGGWQGNAGYSRGNGGRPQTAPEPSESPMNGPEDFSDDSIPF